MPISVRLSIAVVLLMAAYLLLPIFMMVGLTVHPFLRLLGRRGCLRDGGKALIFDRTSFERLEP